MEDEHQDATSRLSNDWVRKYRTVLSLLPSDLRGKRVLDIGCAEGLFGMLCARRGAHVTCVDLNPRLLKRGRAYYNRYKKEGAIRDGVVTFVQADAFTYLRRQERFDIALALDFVEHTDNPLDVVRSLSLSSQMFIIQLPNGLFFSHIVSEPSVRAEHKWFFTPKSARMLIERAGGEVLAQTPLDSPHIIMLAKSHHGKPVQHCQTETPLQHIGSLMRLLASYPWQILRFFVFGSRASRLTYADILTQ